MPKRGTRRVHGDQAAAPPSFQDGQIASSPPPAGALPSLQQPASGLPPPPPAVPPVAAVAPVSAPSAAPVAPVAAATGESWLNTIQDGQIRWGKGRHLLECVRQAGNGKASNAEVKSRFKAYCECHSITYPGDSVLKRQWAALKKCADAVHREGADDDKGFSERHRYLLHDARLASVDLKSADNGIEAVGVIRNISSWSKPVRKRKRTEPGQMASSAGAPLAPLSQDPLQLMATFLRAGNALVAVIGDTPGAGDARQKVREAATAVERLQVTMKRALTEEESDDEDDDDE